MRRLALWGLRLVLALLVAIPLLVLGLLWAADTGPGRRLLEKTAMGAVPGLTIEGLSGPFPGRFHADRIAMADDAGVWLDLRNAEISLDWAALADRIIRLERVSATRLRLDRLPPGTPAAEPPPPGPLLPELPSLPVSIEIRALALDEVIIGEAVAGQEAHFAATGSAALVPGTGLTADLDLKRLDAAGTGTVALDWRPGTGRLAAQIRLDDPAGAFGQLLAGRADLPGRVELSLDGPVAAAPFRLSAGLGADVSLTASGTVGLDAAGGAQLDLTAAARGPGLLPPAAEQLDLSGRLALAADGAITLTGVKAAVPAGTLDLSGDIAGDGALALAFRAAAAPPARALLPPGTGFAEAGAEGRILGSLAAPRLDARFRVTEPRSGVAQADALLGNTVTGTLAGTLAETGEAVTATLDADKLAAQAEATLTPAGMPQTAKVVLDLRDLAPLGLAGPAHVEATLDGGITDGRVTLLAEGVEAGLAGVEAPRLTATIRLAAGLPVEATAEGSGRYRDLPLALTLRASPEGALIRLHAAEVSLGTARLEASGLVDPARRLATGGAHLLVPDLAVLLPGTPGRIEATVEATTPADVQRVKVRIDASRPDGTTARVTAEGGLEALAIEANAAASGVRATLRGTAHPAEQALDLAALDVFRGPGQLLRLLRPARLRNAEAGPVLEGLALGIGSGRIEASGAIMNRVEVALHAVPLDLAGPVTGRVDGTVTIEKAERARFRLNATGLGSPGVSGLPPVSAQAEGEASAAGGRVSLSAEAGQTGRVTGTASLAGWSDSSAMQAALRGNFDLNRALAPFLNGGADRVAGQVALDVRIGGTLGAPRPEGGATLSGGSWRNAALGGAVTDLTGRLGFANDRLRIESLAGRTAGGGTLGITGSLDPLAEGIPADLRLTARNARPLAGGFGSASFNADLTLVGPLLGAARLAGRIDVPRADLRVPETLSGSVPLLAGVESRGTRPSGAAPLVRRPLAPPGGSGPAWVLALQINAPRVLVQGRGVDAELGGSLAVGGTLTAPDSQGELTLRRGSLELPTRRLTFQRGTMRFAGELIPTLNLSATSDAGSYRVTIEVTGPANKPDIRITSAPELPPEEAMAQLLFGRSGQKLSGIEAVQAVEALARLSGTGGEGTGGALSRLGRSLGLDRLGVATGENGNTGVEAGRYLAPGLYLGIRPGTTGAAPGVSAQWELTPRLRLEAETSRGEAGERVGLGYEFEY
ncbi:autotransporter translocation and assembly factor TamB [Humitalea rosea]|uniref:Autotransporter translocation and assembly factor TamB n=1 Tax=Humitalea rosea TaxID=990373 RepID=A0A2W7I566_9PROT|nr:translocation/assembly module TamB domain-containing protein [Humitalea rosea]PZW41339.1 autotransporter translocation and assembly factor TamB [Humitalea rosea]